MPTILRIARLRRMSLRVRPDGEVVVRAPRSTSDREINAFLERHRAWIERQRSRVAGLKPLSAEAIAELTRGARNTLPERTRIHALEHHLSYQKVTCRHQRTRWGCCSHANAINLNIELMRLPERLRDYVIIHELAHTLHRHHQSGFWNYLEQILPGARTLDRELRQWKLGYE